METFKLWMNVSSTDNVTLANLKSIVNGQRLQIIDTCFKLNCFCSVTMGPTITNPFMILVVVNFVCKGGLFVHEVVEFIEYH